MSGCLPFTVCAILCLCGVLRTASAEQWVIVTGSSSQRLVWTAFSFADEDFNASMAAAPDSLFGTLLNRVAMPFNLGILAEPSLQLQISTNYLIGTLSEHFGTPFVIGDVASCDLPFAAPPVAAALGRKSQTIDLLRYLTKHFHGAAGTSGFELQVECPLQALSRSKAMPHYVDTARVLSLKNETRKGFVRMANLSNAIAKNVAQVRMRAFRETGVAAPAALPQGARHKALIDYWRRFILTPLGIESNSIVYDDDLSCLLIEVEYNKYELSPDDFAQLIGGKGMVHNHK